MAADLMNQTISKIVFGGITDTSALARGLVRIINQVEINHPVCRGHHYVIMVLNTGV